MKPVTPETSLDTKPAQAPSLEPTAPARALTCPVLGQYGQCGQVRTHRPCRRILDRPRAVRMS